MAATVFDEESMDLSARLFTHACFAHGVDPDGLVLHSDNGGPMKALPCYRPCKSSVLSLPFLDPWSAMTIRTRKACFVQ